MPNGRYSVSLWQTGYKHNDAYTAYLGLGAPHELTPAQTAQLQSAASGKPERTEQVTISGGHYRLELPLHANDTYLVVLTPVK